MNPTARTQSPPSPHASAEQQRLQPSAGTWSFVPVAARDVSGAPLPQLDSRRPFFTEACEEYYSLNRGAEGWDRRAVIAIEARLQREQQLQESFDVLLNLMRENEALRRANDVLLTDARIPKNRRQQ